MYFCDKKHNGNENKQREGKKWAFLYGASGWVFSFGWFLADSGGNSF